MKYTLDELNAMMAANGGSLDLIGTQITNPTEYIRLRNGDYKPGRYLYANGILTHVKSVKKIPGYTLYIGKIPGRNVVFDGTYYAHCKTLRDGVEDWRRWCREVSHVGTSYACSDFFM